MKRATTGNISRAEHFLVEWGTMSGPDLIRNRVPRLPEATVELPTGDVLSAGWEMARRVPVRAPLERRRRNLRPALGLVMAAVIVGAVYGVVLAAIARALGVEW